MLKLVVPVLVLLVAGCAQQGQFLEQEEASAVMGQVSSAEEVSELLGPPSVVVPLGDGRARWIYDGLHTRASADAFIPYVGLLTARAIQRCSSLRIDIDIETGEVLGHEYIATQDQDHWTRNDQRCVEPPTRESG